jgi:hypothetical protein
LPDHSQGAQRASSRKLRSVLIAVFAALVVVTAATAAAPPASAATRKVVIVVGPVGSTTASYKSDSDGAAAAALKYTSNVVKLYSPNATWDAVKAALQGASIVVYMGHGNGWPSHRAATCPAAPLPAVDGHPRTVARFPVVRSGRKEA